MRLDASSLKAASNNPSTKMRLPIGFEVLKNGDWAMTEDGKWIYYRFHDLILRIGPFIFSISIGKREKQGRSEEEVDEIVNGVMRGE